jgi:hypothetical protein
MPGRGGDANVRKDTQNNTKVKPKSKSKMPSWLMPGTPSSHVDKTSVVRKSTSFEGRSSDSLKKKLEQDQGERREADVSKRTIEHRKLISSVDQFQQYLTSESSFIASQVSNVLESRKRDDTEDPLTKLLEECNKTFPTSLEEIDSHLQTLKGFDQTT